MLQLTLRLLLTPHSHDDRQQLDRVAMSRQVAASLTITVPDPYTELSRSAGTVIARTEPGCRCRRCLYPCAQFDVPGETSSLSCEWRVLDSNQYLPRAAGVLPLSTSRSQRNPRIEGRCTTAPRSRYRPYYTTPAGVGKPDFGPVSFSRRRTHFLQTVSSCFLNVPQAHRLLF